MSRKTFRLKPAPALKPAYARMRGWRLRRIQDWLLAIGIIFLLAWIIVGMDNFSPDLKGFATVTDGDSLTLNSERIRLHGIDAPELDQLCRRGEQSYACGREARNQLRRLIGSGMVACKGLERDQYGRLLAVCEVAGTELNRAMVETGWAIAYGDYLIEEMKACSARHGLWEGTFDRPGEWRAGNRNIPGQGEQQNWFTRSLSFIGEMLSALFR